MRYNSGKYQDCFLTGDERFFVVSDVAITAVAEILNLISRTIKSQVCFGYQPVTY